MSACLDGKIGYLSFYTVLVIYKELCCDIAAFHQLRNVYSYFGLLPCSLVEARVGSRGAGEAPKILWNSELQSAEQSAQKEPGKAAVA